MGLAQTTTAAQRFVRREHGAHTTPQLKSTTCGAVGEPIAAVARD